MDRKETTKLLSDMLIRDVLADKYFSREVTFDFGRKGFSRVDFMAFEPVNQSTSGIERGTFTAYEVKSCLADYRSDNGHNFNMDRNYYVMPPELFEKIKSEIPYNIGVYCPILVGTNRHKMRCVKHSHPKDRDTSLAVALFCMMRSGSE